MENAVASHTTHNFLVCIRPGICALHKNALKISHCGERTGFIRWRQLKCTFTTQACIRTMAARPPAQHPEQYLPCRGQVLNHRPSNRWMTALPPEPQPPTHTYMCTLCLEEWRASIHLYRRGRGWSLSLDFYIAFWMKQWMFPARFYSLSSCSTPTCSHRKLHWNYHISLSHNNVTGGSSSCNFNTYSGEAARQKPGTPRCTVPRDKPPASDEQCGMRPGRGSTHSSGREMHWIHSFMSSPR